MKRILMLCATAVFFVGSTHGATIYTDRSGWEAAVGAYLEEDFDDYVLDSAITVVSDNGRMSPGSSALGPDAVWWDRLVCPSSGETTTTWLFATPIKAFGAYWDLAGPGGPGANIRMYLNGQLVGDEIVNSANGSFWGVVNGPFDTILLKSGSNCAYASCETYEMDNMVYAIANEPPVAVCQDVIVAVGEVPNIDGGSYDPDGDPLTFTQDPSGAFSEAGIYDVTLTVTDPYGASDSCTAQVVVYDPSAGFVTGGGWIDSPPGAFASNTVKVYSTYATQDGGGAPYSDLVGFFQSTEIMFASETGYSWHPYDLQDFGAEITGVLAVEADGDHEFTLDSDDGSMLYIDGDLVVDNGDAHAPETASGSAYLTAGAHSFKIEFFECCGDPSGVDLILPDGVGTYDPFQVGKATFGFVSKYKKGANAPTGQTEFQFHAANLNFHSDSYDWLVVTGSNDAKFKGVGTINGFGAYKFQLWAGDDEPDTFRIKIWQEIGGIESMLYDNCMNQPIDGGSIVVHTK